MSLHLAAVVLASAAMIGCAAPQPLPTYAWQDTTHARQAIVRRAESVRTISARCAITLRDPEQGPVEFDGVMIAAPPTSLRVRAYKLGQPALDLTVRPDGVWLWIVERAEVDERIVVPIESPHADAILVPLFGEQIAEDLRAAARVSDRWLVLTRELGGEHDGSVVATFARDTLTLESYALLGADGRIARRVNLGRYVLIDGVPLPERITATQAGGASLDIRLHDVSINEELPNTAFDPPRRARRVLHAARPGDTP